MVYSLSLDDGATTSIMELSDLGVQRVSPDGKWLALTRQDRAGIWLAPLDRGHLEASDIRLVSQEGEPDFSFTPDGAALIYVADSRIWRQPLDGGEREEIPIRLEQ